MTGKKGPMFLKKESDKLSFTLLASEDSPVENFCLVIKKWNLREKASLSIDGNYLKTKQGIVSDTDGSLS